MLRAALIGAGEIALQHLACLQALPTVTRCWRGGARLPGLLIPRRFQSRSKPVQVSTRKLRDVLGWRPPFDFAQCLQRTYEAPAPHTALPNCRAEPHNV